MLLRDLPPDPPSPEPVEGPSPEPAEGRPSTDAGRARRPLDNPRVVGLAVGILLLLLGGLIWFSERTGVGDIVSPLPSDVLYVLVAVDLTILAALVFVLARNLLKLWVEQRRAAPFARFRAKLVGALLAMTIIPAVLVLISGSQIISSSTQRWLSAPVDEVLRIGNDVASQYLKEHRDAVSDRARRIASVLPPAAVVAADDAALGPLIREELARRRQGKIDCYRAVISPAGQPDAVYVAGGDADPITRDSAQLHASADRLALQAITTGGEAINLDQLSSGGWLARSAVPIRNGTQTVGAVVVSDSIDPAMETKLRRAASEYENYKAIKVMKGWVEGVYLALFVMVTLLILVSATWMGLYLAKRITRPVQMLAEGAKAIGEGKFDLRLEPETGDELGSLVESFNMMAAELRSSQDKLEQSRLDLQRKNVEIEGRRRYIETVLDRVATGVISLGPGGEIQTLNGAAARLLGVDESVLGRTASDVMAREDLRPLLPLVEAAWRRELGVVQEITLARDDREIHLAAAATMLTGPSVGVGADGAANLDGVVLVLDDVTPLIRAQRVAAWRDVARRLAHEIKNPLTPIQLSAERLRRNFATAPPNARALVDECTGAIVTEVEALKSLVDEFAQFARLRGPRTVPADLNRLVGETLRLYSGVLQQATLRVESRLAPDLPAVRIDTEQIRQVIINLVDNAMEALGGPSAPPRPGGEAPAIVITTGYDRPNGVVRLVVSDNGPGVPTADREKLFMPYYSTKGRGSGLGLAIVRRIVAEHGGGIEVGEASPKGTVFTVELPAA